MTGWLGRMRSRWSARRKTRRFEAAVRDAHRRGGAVLFDQEVPDDFEAPDMSGGMRGPDAGPFILDEVADFSAIIGVVDGGLNAWSRIAPERHEAWVITEAYGEPLGGAGVGDSPSWLALMEAELVLRMYTGNDQRWIRAFKLASGGPYGPHRELILMEKE